MVYGPTGITRLLGRPTAVQQERGEGGGVGIPNRVSFYHNGSGLGTLYRVSFHQDGGKGTYLKRVCHEIFYLHSFS